MNHPVYTIDVCVNLIHISTLTTRVVLLLNFLRNFHWVIVKKDSMTKYIYVTSKMDNPELCIIL